MIIPLPILGIHMIRYDKVEDSPFGYQNCILSVAIGHVSPPKRFIGHTTTKRGAWRSVGPWPSLPGGWLGNPLQTSNIFLNLETEEPRNNRNMVLLTSTGTVDNHLHLNK